MDPGDEAGCRIVKLEPELVQMQDRTDDAQSQPDASVTGRVGPAIETAQHRLAFTGRYARPVVTNLDGNSRALAGGR